jgi:hypothetical protein
MLQKGKGIFFRMCYKVKLLFYIDTWHSGEQVSEPFWASVSPLEEWVIWSRSNYFFPLWDGWGDINATYLSYHFFFFWFSNAGELNPGSCTCWAGTLPLSYVLSSNIFFSFLWLYWGLNLGLYACKTALYCLSHITSPFWCGSVKGIACAPVSRHNYFLISRCH